MFEEAAQDAGTHHLTTRSDSMFLHLAAFPPVVPLSNIQPGLPFALTPTYAHTLAHRRTNTEDERRRVAPLPALQQVAQTN